jgi:hypothetical protein
MHALEHKLLKLAGTGLNEVDASVQAHTPYSSAHCSTRAHMHEDTRAHARARARTYASANTHIKRKGERAGARSPALQTEKTAQYGFLAQHDKGKASRDKELIADLQGTSHSIAHTAQRAAGPARARAGEVAVLELRGVKFKKQIAALESEAKECESVKHGLTQLVHTHARTSTHTYTHAHTHTHTHAQTRKHTLPHTLDLSLFMKNSYPPVA